MNIKDQQKCLDAGFTIIREIESGLTYRQILIIAKTIDKPCWFHYTVPFSTLKQRRIYMDKLLKSNNIIED